MKSFNDSVKFEARYEVLDILQALDEYAEEHPDNDKTDTVKKLVNLLDVMEMSW